MKKENKHKVSINNQIRALQIRLVSMPEGYTDGVYTKEQALKFAGEIGLDLIQITPDSVFPAVCKIMDISKHYYELKQKEKKNKPKGGKLKEIGLSPNIGDHDLETKIKHAIGFLKDGNKVKLNINFKGRTIIYKDQGELIMVKFADAVIEAGTPEFLPPKMEGKRMHLILKPKS